MLILEIAVGVALAPVVLWLACRLILWFADQIIYPGTIMRGAIGVVLYGGILAAIMAAVQH